MDQIPPYTDDPKHIPLEVEPEYFVGWNEVQVYETDNPVVNVLYGPDGEVLFELTERTHIGFGYQKG